MTKDLYNKFINNKCTEAELQEVLHWLNTDALAEKGKKLALDDWKNYQEEDSLLDKNKFTSLFDQIQVEIDKLENTEEKNKLVPFNAAIKWITRAAAILLIPVLGFLFYTLSENRLINTQFAVAAVDSLEIIAPIGSRTVVQLSDGSVVYLNYGSKIIYPQFFSGDTREIRLYGEGFFEVAHNPEKPFIVKTGNVNVKALGTAFNVLAYPDENVVQTTLVNGKVVLEQNIGNDKTKMLSAMTPGQHSVFNCVSGDVTCTSGSIKKYISWKDGKLIFEDTPIDEVAEKLSRMFNVDIQVDKEIEDYIYTVTLLDEPLFQILDLMTIATPVTYKAFPRKKLADGSYSKQKIIIEKKVL
jgi:ferric-dicitrate binding protein FerR (iron transport regulator)